ncbi:hypothetical protein C8R43DRAFT_1233998 [Mycena crocata]|nr:hypothetical protein C8R43DRAFT_1233998 [Mycena crocata]
MPSQPTLTQNHSNNMTIYFTGAVNTLEVLAEAFKAPFLEPISKTARALLSAVQIVKQNKDDCAQLMRQTHLLLFVIVLIYTKSSHCPELPPSMLNHLRRFTEYGLSINQDLWYY